MRKIQVTVPVAQLAELDDLSQIDIQIANRIIDGASGDSGCPEC